MSKYLADTSIWAWSRNSNRPDIREKLALRTEAGEILTCAPVVIEALHWADSRAAYERYLREVFLPLDRIPVDSGSVERALGVQIELARGGSDGNHRRPAVDFLIAAAAEAAGPDVILWCFGRDLEVICKHTGQPCEAESSTGAGH